MTARMIHVSTKHIKSGKRRIPACDPIALAIKDRLGISVTVGLRDIGFGLWGTSPLSDKVQEIVRNYDATGKMRVFTFKLLIPNKISPALPPEIEPVVDFT